MCDSVSEPLPFLTPAARHDGREPIYFPPPAAPAARIIRGTEGHGARINPTRPVRSHSPQHALARLVVSLPFKVIAPVPGTTTLDVGERRPPRPRPRRPPIGRPPGTRPRRASPRDRFISTTSADPLPATPSSPARRRRHAASAPPPRRHVRRNFYVQPRGLRMSPLPSLSEEFTRFSVLRSVSPRLYPQSLGLLLLLSARHRIFLISGTTALLSTAGEITRGPPADLTRFPWRLLASSERGESF